MSAAPGWVVAGVLVWLAGAPLAALLACVLVAYERGRARAIGADDRRRPTWEQRLFGVVVCLLWPVTAVAFLGTAVFDVAVAAFARWHRWTATRQGRAHTGGVDG